VAAFTPAGSIRRWLEDVTGRIRRTQHKELAPVLARPNSQMVIFALKKRAIFEYILKFRRAKMKPKFMVNIAKSLLD